MAPKNPNSPLVLASPFAEPLTFLPLTPNPCWDSRKRSKEWHPNAVRCYSSTLDQ